MSEPGGILVLAEPQEQGLTATSKELLGVGRRLAQELGDQLVTLVIGSGSEAAAGEAITWGADTAYVADSVELARFNSDSYTDVVARLGRELAPSIFLMGHTGIGRDIAPRVAARLGASLSTDCVGLSIDPESRRLVQTRPVYGGNAVATLVSKAYPQMATVRPRSMSPCDPDSSRRGEVIQVDTSGLESQVRVTDAAKGEAQGVSLEDATVVVAGGAGISGAEDFGLVRELAAVLGGAVGATRFPCEEGWVPSGYQIGQTGKIVAPDLYVAVAVSGAPQHMAGCLGSRCIVAINSDPEAHIFNVADFAIVADYREALPTLIERCRELKGGGQQ